MALGAGILDFLAAINNTHSRYPDYKRDEAYTRSYRITRLAVGILGFVLPVAFIIGETFFLKGGVHVRGSLSEYYHTSMQDIFVGGLCIIGFLLGTYMAGEPATLDFWASLIAGIAVLGVVFFPTTRSGLPVGAPACGSTPQPAGCSFVEQTLGEHQTAVIHAVCAIVFIFFLAIISTFALSGCGRPGDYVRWPAGHDQGMIGRATAGPGGGRLMATRGANCGDAGIDLCGPVMAGASAVLRETAMRTDSRRCSRRRPYLLRCRCCWLGSSRASPPRHSARSVRWPAGSGRRPGGGRCAGC